MKNDTTPETHAAGQAASVGTGDLFGWESIDSWTGNPPEQKDNILVSDGHSWSVWAVYSVAYIKSTGTKFFLRLKLPNVAAMRWDASDQMDAIDELIRFHHQRAQDRSVPCGVDRRTGG